MVAAKKNAVSIDAYLAMERSSAERHVLWDGEVFAMAGALPDHNTITANVLAELRALTRRGPRRVFASDQKLYVPLRKGFVYADASVACGPSTSTTTPAM